MTDRDDMRISARLIPEAAANAPDSVVRRPATSAGSPAGNAMRKMLGNIQVARMLRQGIRQLPGMGVMVRGGVIGAAAIVTTRLATGMSFAHMKGMARDAFMKDLSPMAKAVVDVNSRFLSDGEIARAVGNEGVIDPKLLELNKHLRQMESRYNRGANRIRQATNIDENSEVEVLIEQMQMLFESTWKASGGPDAMQRLKNAMNAGGDR